MFIVEYTKMFEGSEEKSSIVVVKGLAIFLGLFILCGVISLIGWMVEKGRNDECQAKLSSGSSSSGSS